MTDKSDILTPPVRSVGRLASIVVAVALVALGVDAYLSLRNVRELRQRQDIVSHGDDAVLRLERIRAGVNEVALYSRGYLLIADDEFRRRTLADQGSVFNQVSDFRVFTIDARQVRFCDHAGGPDPGRLPGR